MFFIFLGKTQISIPEWQSHAQNIIYFYVNEGHTADAAYNTLDCWVRLFETDSVTLHLRVKDSSDYWYSEEFEVTDANWAHYAAHDESGGDGIRQLGISIYSAGDHSIYIDDIVVDNQ